MRFSKKIVLVTGAARNTGVGIAAAFAAEGATVYLNSRTREGVDQAVAALRRRGFKKVRGLPGDVGVPADVDAMFREISARSKRLDVLVNNAAHLGVVPDFLELELGYFEEVLRVNLTGAFYVSQHAARMMKQQRGGAIVHIGSNVSTRAIRKRTAYLASKGGVDALTLSMATDLGPYGIRVNTVAPGYIHTDR